MTTSEAIHGVRHTRIKRRFGEDRVSAPRYVGRMITGVLVGLFFLIPYLIMLIGSLKSKSDILGNPTYLPKSWHFENYVTMWSTPETPLAENLLSTVIISVFATLLVMLVAIPASYYTARFRFPGRGLFMFLVIISQMLQPTVLAPGLFREMSSLSLNDTLLAMILINAAFNLSFSIWIMHSFFAAVPKSLDEAAQLDGASRWTVLFRINLPLVWPGIVTAIIFTFIGAWNEFAASLVILSTPGNQPLSVALTKFVGQYSTSWQYVFAVSTVAIVPVVFLFSLIEKHLVSGLTAGSVK